MAKGMYPRVLATSVAMVAGLFGLAHAVGPRSLDILSREQGILLADQSAFLLDVSTERPSDVTGSLPERYEYDPYGTCRIYAGWDNAAANEGLYVMGQSRIGNAIRYAGYFWDDETGVYQMRHKKYQPQTQRWLQRDPLALCIEPGQGCLSGQRNKLSAAGRKLYLYARDNPVRYIDPSGQWERLYGDRCGCDPMALPEIISETIINVGSQAVEGACTLVQGIRTTVMHACNTSATTTTVTAIYRWVCDDDDVPPKCPPCPTPPPPQIHWAPGEHGCNSGHWHFFVYNQNPETCVCYVSRLFGGCIDAPFPPTEEP